MSRTLGNGVNSAFTESIVERAHLAWFESLGRFVRRGLEIAPLQVTYATCVYTQIAYN